MNILSPSILAADFWALGDQIEQVRRGGAQYLHIDVMDGIFVPSISFGMPVLSSIRKRTDLFLDVHLMLSEPFKYIEEFAACGADLITIHMEIKSCAEALLDQIKSCGVRAGISIKPSTPVDVLIPLLGKLDQILVMTVEPGFGGQQILTQCLDKVTHLRRIVDDGGYAINIEVDGGITKENAATVIEAGANIIVAGSAVFHGDPYQNVRDFMSILRG
jgi:ribulose-phosphate 3-epimerase